MSLWPSTSQRVHEGQFHHPVAEQLQTGIDKNIHDVTAIYRLVESAAQDPSVASC
jgi:hypothetical protein